MTIAGSIATIYGASKIYDLTVELKPVIKIIQEVKEPELRIIRDTIVAIHRDTVIVKATTSPYASDAQIQMDSEDDIRRKESIFRKKHSDIFTSE